LQRRCLIARAPRVLLIEDNPPLRRALDEALGVYGFDVISVATVDAALATLRSSEIDVVVTDLGVPGDGATLLEEEVLEEEIPVIVLTAEEAPRRDDVLSRGALEALTKPVSGSELCRIITGSLKQQGSKHRNVTAGEHTGRED